MLRLDKYLLILSILTLCFIFFYVFWGQNQSNLTEDQLLSRMFKCPELYLSEKDKEEANKGFVNYYYYNYPDLTMDKFFEKRFDFLEKNNCIETLQIWAENYRLEHEYWVEVERQKVIDSVIDGNKSKITQ